MKKSIFFLFFPFFLFVLMGCNTEEFSTMSEGNRREDQQEFVDTEENQENLNDEESEESEESEEHEEETAEVEENEEVTPEEATSPSNSETTAHENFDYIAESLTKYLIWWGDEVAMVENCPGGYYEGYGEGSGIYFCEDTDNRWLQFEWLDGTEVRVTSEAGDYFLWDYTNPGGRSFQWTMSADEKYWIYLDTWSDEEERVVAYNAATATEETLMSFLPIDYGYGCSSIRFFGWNPSQTKLGIIVNNEEADDTYPTNTKVFILTIENGKLTQKSKYDLPVVPDCTPNNGPFFAIDWVDDDTIGYYDPSDNPYGDYTQDNYDPEYLETLFWSDDPWGSEYASFYDVE